jgi:DNA-binding MarR family transcriptional regulator
MDDPLSEFPGYLVRRASSAIGAGLSAQLAPFDLRMTESSVLLLIEANRNVTQSVLCRMLDMQRANMTPLIAKLVDRGLIARNQVDGRSQGLALSDTGQTLVQDVRAVITAFENSLVARVPARHRPHILPILKALWISD